MANLLDQASIVLTPTAYDNGKVLCAKPSEPPYGDFDFSRNSAATRVNAQGLVENVQILSSNLVQNGDFSEEGVQEVSNGSFSQEGSEVVVNGDFALNSSWSGTNTIANGQLIKGSGGGLVYQGTLDGTIKSYKVTIDVAEKNGVSLNLYLGGNQFSLNEGVQTLYVQSGNSNTFIGFNNGADSIINSISCVEVGQDWSLGTGWSIAEDKAICDGTSGNLYQVGTVTPNKQYKIQATISDYVSGNAEVSAGAVPRGTMSANGTYTFYQTASTTSNFFVVSNSFNGSITNISVKEVGMDWTLTSGAFITDIGARLTHTPTAGSISSVGYTPLVVGNNYKMTYEITESISGGIKINSAVNPTMVSSVGIHTKYFEADSSFISIARTDPSDNDVTITNISIIEITDDTNLPRINYEGFSYQDALGSELVTGANSGNISLSSVYTDIYTNASVENGKTYAVTFTAQGLESTIQSWSWTNYTPVDSSILYSNGTNTAYINATGNGNLNLRFYSPIGRTGSLSNISIKEYSGQEVVPDSGCGSWLFEPQSTNLITYSEDFSQWIASGCTVGNSSSVVSPSNSNNIGIITGTIGTGAKFARINVITSSSILTYSAFFKYNSHQWVQFASGGTSEYANFDIQNGVVGNKLSGTTSTIDNFGNGWYRCTLSTSVASTPSNMAVVLIDTANSSRLDATSSVGSAYIWGAQLEQQSYATSYIPTSGSSVTRNQETCINATPEINSEEGVLYAEISALADDLTYREIALSDGTTSNRIEIRYGVTNNIIQAISRSGGVVNGSISTSIYNTTNFNKIAIRYKLDDVSLWVNGVKVGTDLSAIMPINLSELAFDNGGGNDIFFGNTKDVQVYTKALSDAELIKLTT